MSEKKEKKQTCSNCTNYRDGYCEFLNQQMPPNERCMNWGSK